MSFKGVPMRAIHTAACLIILLFASLSAAAESLGYEVTCRLYDLATAHILAEEKYSPSRDSESFIQFSFQEFHLKAIDQAIDHRTRALKLEIRVENQSSFDVEANILYQPEDLQKYESLRLGHVGTEWPGVGNTIWLYCDAHLSKAL